MRHQPIAGVVRTAIVLAAMIGLILTVTRAALGVTGADFDITLNAGETYLIKQAGAAEVRFTENRDCFSVQPQAPDGLLVLAVTRGKGTIQTRHDGLPATYHVTVYAAANPNNRLAPGKSSHAPSDDYFRPVPAPPAASGPAAAGAAAEPGEDTGHIHTETVAAPASGGAPSSVAVLPSQAPPPPIAAPPAASLLPPHKYTTDPSLPARVRGTTVRGPHPLPRDAISLMTETAEVYDFGDPIERVAISNSKIADIQVVSPRQLMLVAHKPGFASLVVWNNAGQWEQHVVRVEKNGHQQVLLNVLVAEVNRAKIEQEGIDISAALKHYGVSFASLPGFVAAPYSNQAAFLGSPASNLQVFAPPGGIPFPLAVSSNITYALAAQNSAVATNSFFQFLESHDLARVLAEPRLLANSGEEARFLSGGEIPIVISQALNTTIVFKQYGTSVVFVPTVVGDHEVELRVKPEVSKPDYSQGVQLFGFTVPAFVTRKAETDVRMRENQTLIIAGLILTTSESRIKKVPYLGDVPYLGSIFRNTYWEHSKSELVMSVTPQLVDSIPAGAEVALPTDRGPLSPQETRTRKPDVPDAARPRF